MNFKYTTQSDPSVLKLNHTKNFNTGIYPYSMMTSSFFPFTDGDHSLKITSSSQEWCGHTFMELENKNKFEIETRSYFEGESGSKSLSKDILEDDVWSMIRLRPEELPEGKINVIPSFFYLRMSHQDTKAYECIATKIIDDKVGSYELNYPELERNLVIYFESSFPYEILSWNETHFSGFGNNKKKMATSGERIKTIKSAYWQQNSNAHDYLHEDLFKR